MSHVDEGALHAYLDGELPPGERTALEAHLAQCEACRGRLSDERALVERSSALLGAVRPVERPIPPFEQIRRQPKRSPWRVRISFAWAASIVLALGLGYYLAPVARQAPEQTELPRIATQDQPANAAPAPAARNEAQRTNRRRLDVAERRPASGEREESGAGRAAYATVDTEARNAARRVDSLSNVPLTGVVAAAIPSPTADSSSAAKTTIRGATPSAPVASATIMPERLEAVVITKRATNTWPRIDRQTAKRILGNDPVGLPDIAPLTIRRNPTQTGVVVVEQKLDERTVIEIFQQPNAANAALGGYSYSQGARADGRLARFVGNLRVEIGGPVSVDSLNRLLELVRPLP